jgi:hypothetical protein
MMRFPGVSFNVFCLPDTVDLNQTRLPAWKPVNHRTGGGSLTEITFVFLAGRTSQLAPYGVRGPRSLPLRQTNSQGRQGWYLHVKACDPERGPGDHHSPLRSNASDPRLCLRSPERDAATTRAWLRRHHISCHVRLALS